MKVVKLWLAAVLAVVGFVIAAPAAAPEEEGEPADDRITGGGWILNDAGGKGNFSIGRGNLQLHKN